MSEFAFQHSHTVSTAAVHFNDSGIPTGRKCKTAKTGGLENKNGSM